jgi:hypothetical protein
MKHWAPWPWRWTESPGAIRLEHSNKNMTLKNTRTIIPLIYDWDASFIHSHEILMPIPTRSRWCAVIQNPKKTATALLAQQTDGMIWCCWWRTGKATWKGVGSLSSSLAISSLWSDDSVSAMKHRLTSSSSFRLCTLSLYYRIWRCDRLCVCGF